MSIASRKLDAETLGDESFMSADDLRAYMTEFEIAKASKVLGAMDKAEEARRKLVATLQNEIAVTPEKVAEIKHSLANKTRAAAGRGETEVLVMRFPSALCTDAGRAINNTEVDWPTTLTGRPLQAYEFWKEHLQPAKYKLRAMIIDWPGGLPGDVAFYLSWS
ncbi:hypothetical protein ASE61_19480 [Bosea sp. Root670]|uniref:hypothetical protein n=1 Tax=Bosea sp. Root670 TaxID=1736583 RepID=UPI000715A8EA|nr:hypothetical protein [Bosea sp. Root670]KRE00654.1 hypothetical protein ASE61_19480 [Bosea sp. Root670]